MTNKLLTYSVLVTVWLLAEVYGIFRRVEHGYARIHPRFR